MEDALSWNGNWAWALPLIVLTVIVHVVGLGLISAHVVRRVVVGPKSQGSFLAAFVLVMGLATLLVTVLLSFEVTLWAAAYRSLGAMSDGRAAMLFSLNAFTAYGHTELHLAPHWRLMGALEALNGLLLAGLTTAFLYGLMRRVWPPDFLRGAVPRDQSTGV
jgi:hypothetical protein